MSRHPLHLVAPIPGRSPRQGRVTGLGQALVEAGELDAGDLMRAVAMQGREDVRLAEVLLAHHMVSEAALAQAQSHIYRAKIADFGKRPPDLRLLDLYGAGDCLRDAILPWQRAGGVTIVATARPDRFADHRPELERLFGRIAMAVCTETDLKAAVQSARNRMLAQRAELRTAASESCRGWSAAAIARFALGLGIVFGIALALAPHWVFAAFCGWAIITLIANTALKIAAAVVQFRSLHRAKRDAAAPVATIARLPKVSILVPLYKEREIAGRLVRRLSRLTYPRELLDICLVMEEDDQVTRDTLDKVHLPPWMRQIVVPDGSVKTKPRALNYALDFARGSIIGVYDAEDAPAPDQIQTVVQRFHERGPEVACLQGVLDFYNARTNWLSRCFTVEYATWFRLILPGLTKLGLVIPLGGTTLFFRRAALEELGGWDAHNVTEDADLGIRLARHGYRTELIPTVTEEEANCRVWPWVKQRSRWLKGYAITWAVHMRSPRQLWKDLGAWRFFGVQALFFGTISQFVLAPFLWSFWLIPLGLPHPVTGWLPWGAVLVLGALFLLSELVTITIGVMAVSGPRHRFLTFWVPTLHFYFPLASLASYKGAIELLTKPFYWDKTVHGLFDGEARIEGQAPLPPK